MTERFKYQVIKQAVSKELTDFCFKYILLKRDAVKYLHQKYDFLEKTKLLGVWDDPMVPNIYAHYGDMVMETLLVELIPVIKKQTGLDLVPTYSYTRLYEKGSMLSRHKDRASCEISTTLNLGGDNWPIFIDPTGENNILRSEYTPEGEKVLIKDGAHEGIQIDLEPGDMLVYSGCEFEHWRNTFQGDLCLQVFLHYNRKNGEFGESNLFDKRKMLGLPSGL